MPLPCPAAHAAAKASATADKRLRTLLDRIFYDRLATSLESATRLGLDTGERAALMSRLSDRSAGGVAADPARAKQEMGELRAINPASLSSAARLDYEVVLYQLTQRISGGERFAYGDSMGRYAPYVLSQLTGAYRDVPDFLNSQHRVRDAADADAYLARLAARPASIDADTDRQRADRVACSRPITSSRGILKCELGGQRPSDVHATFKPG